MFDELLEALDNLDSFDVQEAFPDELKDLCTHQIFRLLCDTCERLWPARGSHHHHYDQEQSCR